jgi:hypothetical protein
MVLVNFLGGSLDFSYNIPHIHQNLTYPESMIDWRKALSDGETGCFPYRRRRIESAEAIAQFGQEGRSQGH